MCFMVCFYHFVPVCDDGILSTTSGLFLIDTVEPLRPARQQYQAFLVPHKATLNPQHSTAHLRPQASGPLHLPLLYPRTLPTVTLLLFCPFPHLPPTFSSHALSLAPVQIMVVRDIEREDIEFYCKALNCLPIASTDNFTPDKLGFATNVEEVTAGDAKV
jgi:hypothetical protein